jgi:hypothetical protein
MNENLDINTMLKHIADKQQKDAKISKILLQVKSGAHTEKMACNGAEAKFRIEENGALMERVFIRTSRITAPRECWAILVHKMPKKGRPSHVPQQRFPPGSPGAIQNALCNERAFCMAGNGERSEKMDPIMPPLSKSERDTSSLQEIQPLRGNTGSHEPNCNRHSGATDNLQKR